MFAPPAGFLKRKGSAIPNVAFERWILQSPATSPGIRHGHNMAFFPGLGVVMTGGATDGTNAINDPYGGDPNGAGTWIWDGTNWSKMAVATDARASFTGGMAYDRSNNVIVLANTFDGGAITSWSEFDGITWTNLSSGVTNPGNPGSQIWCKMAYDENRQKIVFSGLWSGGPYMYEYDYPNHRWDRIAPSPTQGGDYSNVICYEGGTRKQILSCLGNSYRAQVYNGATWASAGWPGVNPGIDSSFAYLTGAWHPVRDTAIIKTRNETWEWNSTTSTLTQLTLSNQGPAFTDGSAKSAMVFDEANGVMVLFGGFVGGVNTNQTWVSGPL
jgi:hypothetical protein